MGPATNNVALGCLAQVYLTVIIKPVSFKIPNVNQLSGPPRRPYANGMKRLSKIETADDPAAEPATSNRGFQVDESLLTSSTAT